MLSGLSIRNVVLIESLDLDFGAGLTALTGETGAGKSIILDALSMATGARSDKALVRKGTDKAQCSAVFILPEGHKARQALRDADFDNDSGEVILRRVIGTDGRSKAYINDIPVGVRLLSEIGQLLVEVHGQHDGRGLLDPGHHISLLDSFGGHHKEIGNVQLAYSDMKLAVQNLENLKARAAKAESDRDFLAYAVEELDRLDVRAGEVTELAARRRFLQGSEGAIQELTSAEEALGGGEYEARVATALSGIERVKEKIGADSQEAETALGQAAKSLERAMLEAQEARRAIADAASIFHLEPGELDRTEQRLFSIKAACRKYGVDAVSLVEKRRGFAESLALIENIGAELSAAQLACDMAEKAYSVAADKLTKMRQSAAKKLAKSVHKELPSLKMERAKFECQISEGAETSIGKDKVRFVVATNPGSEAGPMDKVASGGELARFSLAIKVALAATEQKVMIFDEVDQGVGGAVASAIGKRLAKLSGDGQVFIVTHSAQVAACAEHQYRIEKASKAKSTITSVTPVAANEREEEIARMLAGAEITDEARAAARQLMKAS